jgi:hypothetical protein
MARQPDLPARSAGLRQPIGAADRHHARMPAVRFLAFLTLVFVLPGGALLWHQQIALLEREAARTLRGPDLELAPGARSAWRLELAASTEDQAWMHCQRQPRLSVALPITPAGSERPRLRARARYVAEGEFPEAAAFVGASAPDEPREAEPGPDGVVWFGPLWLSYLQPLELELEVVAWPASAGAASAQPELTGEASADYVFARSLDRSIYVAFVILGVFGVLLFVLVERRRAFVVPTADDGAPAPITGGRGTAR